MTIDITKSLVYDDGFPRVPNILYRLYPLLDGYSIETTGFYGYLRSWRQNKPDHPMFGKAWLNLDVMEAQSGISKYKIRKHTDVLVRYDLLIVTKSVQVANKKIYEVLEPITEAEFRVRYAVEIERFGKNLEGIKDVIEADRQRLSGKLHAKLEEPLVGSAIIGYDHNGQPITF